MVQRQRTPSISEKCKSNLPRFCLTWLFWRPSPTAAPCPPDRRRWSSPAAATSGCAPPQNSRAWRSSSPWKELIKVCSRTYEKQFRKPIQLITWSCIANLLWSHRGIGINKYSTLSQRTTTLHKVVQQNLTLESIFRLVRIRASSWWLRRRRRRRSRWLWGGRGGRGELWKGS